MQNLSQLSDVIDPLATAAKSEPENIGHRVRVNCVVPYTSSTQHRRYLKTEFSL